MKGLGVVLFVDHVESFMKAAFHVGDNHKS